MRSGEITPPELSGGTFTVSNLGMFGMTAIRPRDKPAAGRDLRRRRDPRDLARRGGEIVDRRPMTLTLGGDHRILWGADGGRVQADVKLLESPLKLML